MYHKSRTSRWKWKKRTSKADQARHGWNKKSTNHLGLDIVYICTYNAENKYINAENEEVLIAVGEERCILQAILKKKNWMGHVMRDDSLLKLVIKGRMLGKKPRGRPKMGIIDDLKEGSYTEMKRRAEHRDKWRTWMPRTCREAEN
jgi:hypothetical protein